LEAGLSPSRGMRASSLPLGLDTSLGAHLSMYDPDAKDLGYAHETAEGWQYEVPDWVGDVGAETAIGVDRGELPTHHL